MNAGKESSKTIKVLTIKKNILDPIKSSIPELISAFDYIQSKTDLTDSVKSSFVTLWKLAKQQSVRFIDTSEITITEILIRYILGISLPVNVSTPLIQYTHEYVYLPIIATLGNGISIQVPKITEVISKNQEPLNNEIILGIPAETTIKISSLINNDTHSIIQIDHESIVSFVNYLKILLTYIYSTPNQLSQFHKYKIPEFVKDINEIVEQTSLIPEYILKLVSPALKIITPNLTLSDHKFTLSPINYLVIYDAIDLFGANKRDIEYEDHRRKIVKQDRIKQFAEQQKQEEIQTKAMQYYQIAINKFGKMKLESLDPLKLKSIKDITGRLTSKETELLNIEYGIREKQWQLEQKNKCTHIMFIKSLYNTSISELPIALFKLDKNFVEKYPPKSNEQITCKICHFNLICPHTYDTLKEQSTNQTFTKIRSMLLEKYAIKIPIMERGDSDTLTYFCKICGEKLLEVNEEDEQAVTDMGLMGDLEDDIRSTIWKELFLASEHLKSQFIIDSRNFASKGADIIHPIILQIESDFMKKSKLYSDITVSIDPRIHIYIIIFIWAYILNYIKINPNTTLQNITTGSKLSKYLKYIVELISPENMESSGPYQYIFEKLLGEDKIRFSSQEYISDRIIEAYKIIERSKEVNKDEIGVKDEIQTIIRDLVIDPIFHYAMAVYGTPIPPQGIEFHDKSISQDNIAKILGISLSDLIKKTTKQSTEPYNMFTNLYEPKIGANQAYALFCKYIKDKSIINPNLDPDKKIIADIEKEKELDLIGVATQRRLGLKAWAVYQKASFAIVYTPHIDSFPNSYIYDEKGIRHKWDSSFPPKCTICGINIRDFRKLDNAKVNHSRKLTSKFKMFFGFYETRCPSGGLHDFAGKDLAIGKCSKCGITEKIAKDPMSDISSSTDYYNKYKITIFDIDKTAIQTRSLAEETTELTGIPVEQEINTTVNLQNYSYKFSKVKQLSTLSNISVHTLESFGRFENRSRRDIETGGNLPVPDISNIIGAIAIFRLLIIDYYSLKNYYNFSRLPIELKQIVEATPDFSNELKKLPDFDISKYRLDSLSETSVSNGQRMRNEEVERSNGQRMRSEGVERSNGQRMRSETSVKSNNKSLTTYQFIIESIADICLQIIDSCKLGKTFVSFELKKLVRAEKLLSKPGPFNMMLFTQEDEVSFGTSDEAPDTETDIAEDISMEIGETIAEDKLGDYDPTSYEEMDYDGYNDEPE